MDTLKHLPVADLVAATINRQHGSHDIAELAASITEQGVIQPLVVRAVNGHHEIVAGHRRHRAAAKAGLEVVPCIVRELTDKQADEQRLEENLQRKDLHPMDEAAAYERLIDEHGYDVEDLVDKFAKPSKHVRGRLKLCSLAADVRKAYLAGEVEHHQALLIARMPDHKVQRDLLKAAKDDISSRYEGDFVEQNWSLYDATYRSLTRLADAPFAIDDARLVAKAGACTACPKRTANQRELFDDLEDKEDQCFDTVCYKSKVETWWKAQKAAAKADGVKVLTQAELEKCISYRDNLHASAAYVRTSATVGDVAGGKSKAQLKTALKADPPQRYIGRSKAGTVFDLYARKDVTKALKAAGLITKAAATKASVSSPSSYKPSASDKAAAKRRRTLEKIKTETTERAIAAAVALAEDAEDVAVFEPLARLLCSGLSATATAKARGLKNREALERQLRTKKKSKQLDGAALRGLVVELALRDACYYAGHTPAFGKAMQAWGIDLAVIERKVKAEIKAKAKAQPKKAAKKKAAKATKKKAAAKKTSPRKAKKTTKRRK